ncbi:unnamed protein product [Schistosoma intercalatum]|nr:unnamed protein product [Schistosoma intercalatum]CAH8482695.1 unnamed protein product [Schistosoma intercalatum]
MELFWFGYLFSEEMAHTESRNVKKFNFPTHWEDAVDGLPVTFKAIKEAMENKNILGEVKCCLLTKWPNRRFEGELLQYFLGRNSLKIGDSCIMFGGKIIFTKNITPQGFETIPHLPSRHL